MPEIFDVIVVGGGPGGSTAAYFLGEAGQRVLLLEKESIPRYKTCGGGIPARLLEQFPFSFEPVIESRVKSVSYALGKRMVTLPLHGQPMRMVMRDHFDEHILKHVKAEVHQHTAVRQVIENEDRVVVETRTGERFEGRYLIAADGANSVVARSLGLRRKKTLAGAIEVEVQPPKEIFNRFKDEALFVFGEIKQGYLWVFPKANHLSVGIAATHPKPGELQDTLARVMAHYHITLEGAVRHGHPIPLYNRREPISTARALLVGDAAGLVDPFDGEGIRFAIKSGRIAAEAILSGNLAGYPAQIYRRIGYSHRVAKGLAWLFYSFPRTCFLLGVRNPFATQAFADMLSDYGDYPNLIIKLFGTLPVFLLTEAIASLVGLLGGPEQRSRVRTAVYPGAGIFS